MQRLRIIVLACRWETIPPETVVPAPISPLVLQQMFSESPGSNWSLADLLVRSTLGQVRFDPALVYNIGALPGTLVDREKRGQLINLARQVANNQGILFGPNDRAVAFINPPPCDAGAFGRQAVLDQAAEHTYYTHELGHVIGYDHSFGSDLTGDQNAEYGDPYCIMSARTFGGTLPQASGPPPGATVPAGLPAPMWTGSGPLAAAALTAYHFPDFNTFPNVVEISSIYHSYPQYTRLVALSEAAPSDLVLARVDTGLQSFFVEYRAGTGWDRGLAQPANPDPAVVIHRRKPSSGTLISYAGRIPLPVGGAPRYWERPTTTSKSRSSCHRRVHQARSSYPSLASSDPRSPCPAGSGPRTRAPVSLSPTSTAPAGPTSSSSTSTTQAARTTAISGSGATSIGAEGPGDHPLAS